MAYLIDTNVFSEIRKGSRANAAVRRWFEDTPDEALFTSVLVVGELRRGVERVARRDRKSSAALDRWLTRLVRVHRSRILPVDLEVASAWGRLGVPDPIPSIDGLLAATAMVHGLVLVTRNVKDVVAARVETLDPFVQPR